MERSIRIILNGVLFLLTLGLLLTILPFPISLLDGLDPLVFVLGALDGILLWRNLRKRSSKRTPLIILSVISLFLFTWTVADTTLGPSYPVYDFLLKWDAALTAFGFLIVLFDLPQYEILSRNIRILAKWFDKVLTMSEKQEKHITTRSASRRLNPRVILGALVAVFLIFRIPFLDSSFTAQLHADKYASYIPTLVNMYEAGNPFLQSNPAYADFFLREASGYFQNFGTFPFYEWVFLPFMVFSQWISLEVLVRVMLSVIGVVLLYALYLLMRRIAGVRAGLLLTALLATSAFVQFFSFVTTMDLPAFVFMVFAIHAFLRGRYQTSYLLSGFSVLMKVSFLTLTPVVLAILILRKRKFTLFELARLGVFSLLPYSLFNALLSPLPSMSVTEGTVRVLGFVTIIVITSYIVVRFEQTMRAAFTHRFAPAVVLGTIVALGMVFWRNGTALAALFLPDVDSLGFSTFQFILSETMSYVNLPILLIGIVGLLASFRSKHLFPLLAITVAAVLYLITGSKVIFFHVYYKHVFVILILMFAAVGLHLIDAWLAARRTRLWRISLLTLLAVWIAIPLPGRLKTMIGRPNSLDLPKISYYLNEHMERDEKVLRADSITKNIVMYNDIMIINYTVFVGDKLTRTRNEIEDIGLNQFLKNYQVKYVLSRGALDPSTFLYWLDDLQDTTTRSDLIEDTLHPIQRVRPEQLKTLREIEEVFVLETIIDSVYVYRVK